MPKSFSEYHALIQKEESLVSELKGFFPSCRETDRIFSSFSVNNSTALAESFEKDRTKKTKSFPKIIKTVFQSDIGRFSELNSLSKQKSARAVEQYQSLLKEKKTLYPKWSDLTELKAKLQKENRTLSDELDGYLRKKKSLGVKKAYIEKKYDEYGGESVITHCFERISREYETFQTEYTALQSEYEQVTRNEKVLPDVCRDIKRDIRALNEDITLAKEESSRILEAIPDLEARAGESEKLLSQYNGVHTDYIESRKSSVNLKDKLQKVVVEKEETESTLNGKKAEFDPVLKKERALKTQLERLTEIFDTQNDLDEQKGTLDIILRPLEKNVEEWKKKIQEFDAKSKEMTTQIDHLKIQSTGLTTELHHFQSLVGPFKELKGKLEEVEQEIKKSDEQCKKMNDDAHALRKENEMLETKARQYQLIKKRMGEIK